MPWQNNGGWTLNEASVKASAPAQSGVYALYTSQKWVYIGESQDIRNRLLEHLRDDRIMRHGPTSFSYELHPASSRVARQDALIAELNPSANRM